jgi:hypothetical protein
MPAIFLLAWIRFGSEIRLREHSVCKQIRVNMRCPRVSCAKRSYPCCAVQSDSWPACSLSRLSSHGCSPMAFMAFIAVMAMARKWGCQHVLELQTCSPVDASACEHGVITNLSCQSFSDGPFLTELHCKVLPCASGSSGCALPQGPGCGSARPGVISIPSPDHRNEIQSMLQGARIYQRTTWLARCTELQRHRTHSPKPPKAANARRGPGASPPTFPPPR